MQILFVFLKTKKEVIYFSLPDEIKLLFALYSARAYNNHHLSYVSCKPGGHTAGS